MSAPQGFNPNASMLPAGGGDIVGMKGGGLIDIQEFLQAIQARVGSLVLEYNIDYTIPVPSGVGTTAVKDPQNRVAQILAATPRVSSENIKLNVVNDDVTIEIIVPAPVDPVVAAGSTTGGGLQRRHTLRSKPPKKLKRTPLTHKKIHHKKHKNAAADEEQDIGLALVG